MDALPAADCPASVYCGYDRADGNNDNNYYSHFKHCRAFIKERRDGTARSVRRHAAACASDGKRKTWPVRVHWLSVQVFRVNVRQSIRIVSSSFRRDIRCGKFGRAAVDSAKAAASFRLLIFIKKTVICVGDFRFGIMD